MAGSWSKPAASSQGRHTQKEVCEMIVLSVLSPPLPTSPSVGNNIDQRNIIWRCPKSNDCDSLVPRPIPSFSMLHAEKCRATLNGPGHEAIITVIVLCLIG